MEKKYQIFISSTYKDLIPEREKVRDVILSMYQFPIGMEMFSAADEEQWEIIKETIDSSDYYILIIGKRYGSVIEDGDDSGISYTEKEYRYAKSIGLPILAYIKNDSVITADNIEEDINKLRKLEEFKSDVTNGREVKWFGSIDQLGTEVTLSLHKEMNKNKRPGWIRSDAVDIEKSLSEIVELSRQNREIQTENTRLLFELEKINISSGRKPKLSIGLKLSKPNKDERHMDFFKREESISIDDDGIIHLKAKKISSKKKEEEFLPKTLSDIPEGLREYISEKDVKEYNSSLPSKEIMDEYIFNYRVYLAIKETGVPITFYIKNSGTAKATDVNVTIEFPDQLRIFDFDEIVNISEPTEPEKKEDLITKAQKRAGLKESNILDMYGLGSHRSIPNFPSALTNKNSIYESIEIKDNYVEIEQKRGILHTKTDSFPGGYIIPIIKGEYEAKVTLMCAEYENPEETTIKFVVDN